MKILGISGKKQSGKSTIADIIQSNYPNTVIINFADALKTEVCKACGVTWEYLEAHKSEFRPILQWWGTDFRRKLNNENYWINKWQMKVLELPSDIKLVIAADVRFENEANIVKRMGGQLWRVVRPSVLSTDIHASETEMDSVPCDVRILNNVDDLKTLEKSILEQIEKRIK